MIALLQRVSTARVVVGAETIGSIEQGILVFVGVERGDTEAQAQRIAERLLGYRVFADEAGRMNLSVRDIGGGVLLVPQFTLAADTDKGTRASFTSAAVPAEGRRLFESLSAQVRAAHAKVACGAFGADMQVHLVNDGPVTFMLRAPPRLEHAAAPDHGLPRP
jgi:D-tyrosyl-tRNA(Tyr) deacylase